MIWLKLSPIFLPMLRPPQLSRILWALCLASSGYLGSDIRVFGSVQRATTCDKYITHLQHKILCTHISLCKKNPQKKASYKTEYMLKRACDVHKLIPDHYFKNYTTCTMLCTVWKTSNSKVFNWRPKCLDYFINCILYIFI